MEDFFGRIGQIMHAISRVHHNYNERNQTHIRIFEPFCDGEVTGMFVKNGALYGPGKRTGRCGFKKDHSRTFCCKACYEEIY